MRRASTGRSARAAGRAPTAEERRILSGSLSQEPGSVSKRARPTPKRLIRIGEAPLAASLKPAELAAMTTVARAILNLHETITRN